MYPLHDIVHVLLENIPLENYKCITIEDFIGKKVKLAEQYGVDCDIIGSNKSR